MRHQRTTTALSAADTGSFIRSGEWLVMAAIYSGCLFVRQSEPRLTD